MNLTDKVERILDTETDDLFKLLEAVDLDPKIDLAGADLRGLTLTNRVWREFDLAGTNFSGANVDGGDFSQAKLSGAEFSDASAQNANFFQADLTQASFRRCDLTGSDFTQATMTATDFGNAKLDRVLADGKKTGNYSGSAARCSHFDHERCGTS
jgi:uncharacterized protein YjbI with pentapeptide repeats